MISSLKPDFDGVFLVVITATAAVSFGRDLNICSWAPAKLKNTFVCRCRQRCTTIRSAVSFLQFLFLGVGGGGIEGRNTKLEEVIWKDLH